MHSRHQDPRGFSLLELLIVLSILAAVAVMVWPRMLPQLARAAPREAAMLLKRDLAEAREQAVRRGETWLFRYRDGEADYQIAPVTALRTNDRSSLPTESNLARIEPIEESEPLGSEVADPDWDVRQLPPGIVFSAAKPRWSQFEPLRSEEELRQEEGELIVAADAQLNISPDSQSTEAVWTDATEFAPDGRARDCELQLLTRDAPYYVTLKLRGLTGVLTIGAVERSHSVESPRERNPSTEPREATDAMTDREPPATTQPPFPSDADPTRRELRP